LLATATSKRISDTADSTTGAAANTEPAPGADTVSAKALLAITGIRRSLAASTALWATSAVLIGRSLLEWRDELPLVVLFFGVIQHHARTRALGTHAGNTWRDLRDRASAGKRVVSDRGGSPGPGCTATT
jgi:hypothetical protein